MSSPWLRSDSSSLSISTMISTSCVMLENLQEFNPTINECEYFPGYHPQASSDEMVLQTSASRESNQGDLKFESEATPFSQEPYPGPSGLPVEQSHYEYDTTHYTPFPIQNDYTTDVSKPTFISGTCGEFKDNFNSSTLENSLTLSQEDTYFNKNDGVERLKKCNELRFETGLSRNEAISITRHSKAVPCNQRNTTSASEIVSAPLDPRHDVLADDSWPTVNPNGSTFETINPPRDVPLGVNADVPSGSIYKGVHDPKSEGSFMVHNNERQENGRVHCVQNQERECESSRWLSTNTFLHKPVPNPNSLNSLSFEMKQGCEYNYLQEPVAVPDNQHAVSNSSVPLGYSDSVFSKRIASPGNENVMQNSGQNDKLNFLMEVQCTQRVSADNGKGLSMAKSYVPQRCEDDYSPGHKDKHDTQLAEGQTEIFNKEPLHYASHSSQNIEKNEESTLSMHNTIPARYEGEHNHTDYKQQAQSRQVQSSWSIDNIQHELEVLEDRHKKIGGPVNTIQQRLETYKIQNKTKSKGSSLVDVDYMICSGVTVAGFKPRAIIRKRSKVNIPSDIKDQGYWQKRRKNNDSARKSRELKKEKEKNFYRRALELEYENVYLRECLSLAEAELAAVGRRIPAPPMSSMSIY